MEWLLTLFAMLGAVTGAHGDVRGEHAQLLQAEAAGAVQAAAAVAEATVAREMPAVPVRETMPRDVQSPPSPRLIAPVPLYADRLLE